MNESTQHKQSAYDPFLDERMHHLKQHTPPNEPSPPSPHECPIGTVKRVEPGSLKQNAAPSALFAGHFPNLCPTKP